MEKLQCSNARTQCEKVSVAFGLEIVMLGKPIVNNY